MEIKVHVMHVRAPRALGGLSVLSFRVSKLKYGSPFDTSALDIKTLQHLLHSGSDLVRMMN